MENMEMRVNNYLLILSNEALRTKFSPNQIREMLDVVVKYITEDLEKYKEERNKSLLGK
jgi:hypothetical protein